MNRKRCPWCGKRIDKNKDTILWRDVVACSSVPRMLRKANCGHCGRKYGQVNIFPYLFKIDLLVFLLIGLSLVFQSAILFALSFVPLLLGLFLHILLPYSKLDDKGKICEENTDLYCEIIMIEKYSKIKPYELYFLNDCFDESEPFLLASPIQVYSVSKKSDTLFGEFLYMHEKNYDFIGKDGCELYDTEMNRVAKVKIMQRMDRNEKII